MRKPYARTHSSKEIDRRTCFETTSKKGALCASPYAQRGPRRLGALGAWAPEGLGKALHPPFNLLLPTLLPSTSQNKPLCYDSQLCWRFRPLLSPSSFHQPTPMRDPMRAINSMTLGYVGAPGPCLLLPPSSFLYPKQTPYARPYARPMRAPYARAAFINGFRSCTLI